MHTRIEEINAELEKIEASTFRKDRLKNHIHRNETQLKRMRMDLLALENSIVKEQRDVIRLEQLTVSSVFLRILGSIEKQLEIERQEYLMEVLKYNELQESISLLEFEQKTLRQALDMMEDNQTMFDKLAFEKEAILKALDKQFAIKIRLLDQDIVFQTAQISKTKSAVENGVKSKKILIEIKQDLSKVKEWGSWQYYGAGNYSAYAKKNYIDTARKNAIQANMILSNYENDLTELFKDLKIPYHLRLDKFELFLNIFYDNLITDWIVQKHIKNALQNIQMNIDKVTRLQATIETGQKKQQALIQKLIKERKQLILEA
jgi:hypothetical protein